MHYGTRVATCVGYRPDTSPGAQSNAGCFYSSIGCDSELYNGELGDDAHWNGLPQGTSDEYHLRPPSFLSSRLFLNPFLCLFLLSSPPLNPPCQAKGHLVQPCQTEGMHHWCRELDQANLKSMVKSSLFRRPYVLRADSFVKDCDREGTA